MFPNSNKGFSNLVPWVNTQTSITTEVQYVMETTGVYHESLTFYLCRMQKKVSFVLPNKISKYERTLDINTITDKSVSQAIARFGLERQLEVWLPLSKIFKYLRQL